MIAKISSLEEARYFLFNIVPKMKGKVYLGQGSLDRARYLVGQLDNPQNSFKSVHVAGTSGKGSFVYLFSGLLRSTGVKVGTQLSPHVYDFRERMMINGKLPSEKAVCKALNELLPAWWEMRHYKDGQPTVFEVCFALAAILFRNEKVDYAVIEVGLGGLYDGTNVITRQDKVAVLTKIGLDHTHILGNTLKEIAVQKAGIIGPKNAVIAISQARIVNEVFKAKAAKENAQITFVSPRSYLKESLGKTKPSFASDYQAENSALALKTLEYICKRDGLIVNPQKILSKLSTPYFPGRFEVRKIGGKIVVIDGAHNPQKMQAFIARLKTTYPDKKLIFLVAFMKKKAIESMLKVIAANACAIVATEFLSLDQDEIRKSASLDKLEKVFTKIGYNHAQLIANHHEVIDAALAKTSMDSVLVITGSFYLIGQLDPVLKQLEKEVSLIKA